MNKNIMFKGKYNFKKIGGVMASLAFCLITFTTSIFAAETGGFTIDTGKRIERSDETATTTPALKKLEKGDIEKKEQIHIFDYKYDGALAQNPFKYADVRHVVSYIDKEGILGEITFDAKFRYNTDSNTAECLCTSRNDIVSPDCKFSGSIRKANLTTDCGAGISSIKFKRDRVLQDKAEYKYLCDSQGNITVSPVADNA